MDNKAIIVVGVIGALIIGLVIGFICGNIYGDKHHSFITNDGVNGITMFENISDETGYGVEFEKGKVPLNIALYGGEVKVKIAKGQNTVYEAEFDKWQDVTVDIPETGYYLVTFSGKNATGIFKYPVTDNTSSDINKVPDIINE